MLNFVSNGYEERLHGDGDVHPRGRDVAVQLHPLRRDPLKGYPSGRRSTVKCSLVPPLDPVPSFPVKGGGPNPSVCPPPLPPLCPPIAPTSEDGIFAALQRSVPKPLAREARKNAWILAATWILADERVSARRDIAKDQALSWRMGRAIKASLR